MNLEELRRTEPGRSGIKRLLVIEDDPEFAAVARASLSTVEGLRTDFAPDYDSAFAIIGGGIKPDAIISDCFFPKKTGSNDISMGLEVIELIEKADITCNPPKEYCVKAMRDALNNESNQALGVLVSTMAEQVNIPCILNSSAFHHNYPVNAVESYVHAMGLTFILGEGEPDYERGADYMEQIRSDPSMRYKDEEKLTPEFWRMMFDRLDNQVRGKIPEKKTTATPKPQKSRTKS